MIIETWKPVIGFEGDYEVSDQGRVRSIDRTKIVSRVDSRTGKLSTYKHRYKGRIRKQPTTEDGRKQVTLCKNGGSHLVHVLVLEAFIGPRPDGHECCHADDVSTNNALSNLRWGTRLENVADALANGRRPIGERKWNAILTTADVHEIRALLGSMPMKQIGEKFGVGTAAIRNIRDGINWKHVPIISPSDPLVPGVRIEIVAARRAPA